MKIRIMTFNTTVDNYGQIMQCYALQRYLRDKGHDVKVIKYRDSKNPSAPNYEHTSKRKTYFGGLYKREDEKANKTFPRNFNIFLDKYLVFYDTIYNEPDELMANPPEGDVYIVGSDQGWCERKFDTVRRKSIINVYFLNFGKEGVRRISYAESWGQYQISDAYAKIINPLLAKFDVISVRDKSDLDFCSKLGFQDAKRVCDPTLLLTAEDYRQLYKKDKFQRQKDKYLFLYLLGNKSDFDMAAVNNFAQGEGLRVVRVSGNARLGGHFATIPEWLYLIDKAEYVITNSFHGAAFSTLFGKQYGTIPRTGQDVLMNARIESLFEYCEIEPRWLNKGDGFAALKKKYTSDYSTFRQESIRFLEDALNNSQAGQSSP